MITLQTLLDYLETLLNSKAYPDYCPNGLQVEGLREIKVLVTGVTACQKLIEEAIAVGADALLVHHGYFWKGEHPCVVGMAANRLRLLMQNGMHLLAYHLPLDAHKTLGNNAQLAKRLGIKIDGLLDGVSASVPIGFKGQFETPLTPRQLSDLLASQLGQRQPLYITGGAKAPRLIKTVGWCTGAAQDFIVDAARAGLDAYITGEISERTVHCARELGIHFYAAGHHATERYGVEAVGHHLVEKFPSLKHHFIDIDNPA